MGAFLDDLYLPSADEQSAFFREKSPEQTTQDFADGVAKIVGSRAPDDAQS